MSNYYNNPVSCLYERFAQQVAKPRFILVEESGPSHAPTYGYQVPIPLLSFSICSFLGSCARLSWERPR